VVKAMDLSPIGQCPRGFEPRRMHGFCLVFLFVDHERRLNRCCPKFSHVRLAQWIRRLPTEQEIAGSNPAMDSSFFFFFLFYRTAPPAAGRPAAGRRPAACGRRPAGRRLAAGRPAAGRPAAAARPSGRRPRLLGT
jgi:hypothetical protein